MFNCYIYWIRYIIVLLEENDIHFSVIYLTTLIWRKNYPKCNMTSVCWCFWINFTANVLLLLRYNYLCITLRIIFLVSCINFVFDLIIFIDNLLNLKQSIDCFSGFVLWITIQFLMFSIYIFVCVFLATSQYNSPELWGGGVPTSGNRYYWPRICAPPPVHFQALLRRRFMPYTRRTKDRQWVHLWPPVWEIRLPQ